jgi:hypothetical protein
LKGSFRRVLLEGMKGPAAHTSRSFRGERRPRAKRRQPANVAIAPEQRCCEPERPKRILGRHPQIRSRKRLAPVGSTSRLPIEATTRPMRTQAIGMLSIVTFQPRCLASIGDRMDRCIGRGLERAQEPPRASRPLGLRCTIPDWDTRRDCARLKADAIEDLAPHRVPSSLLRQNSFKSRRSMNGRMSVFRCGPCAGAGSPVR